MKLSTALCGLLLLASSAAGATDLYKWKDANGVTHYTETPPTGQRYETRRIDNSGGTVIQADDGAKPTESADCTMARKNLEVLSGKGKVMQDSDGDGKPDTELDASQREAQLGVAQAAIKAYCKSAAQ